MTRERMGKEKGISEAPRCQTEPVLEMSLSCLARTRFPASCCSLCAENKTYATCAVYDAFGCVAKRTKVEVEVEETKDQKDQEQSKARQNRRPGIRGRGSPSLRDIMLFRQSTAILKSKNGTYLIDCRPWLWTASRTRGV